MSQGDALGLPLHDTPSPERAEQAELPKGWRLVGFLDTIHGGKVRVAKVKRSDYREIGRYPIVDQGQQQIVGYWDNEDDLYRGELPVIIFGDHTRVFKFVDIPFVVGADGTHVLVPNKKCFDPFFLYLALRYLDIPSRGYNRHFGLLKERFVVSPSLPEQRAIAEVIRTVQRAKDATEKVIAAVRQLKTSLMKHLFTYGPVPVDKTDEVSLVETEIGPVNGLWKLVTCESICERITVGLVVRPASHYVESGVPAFRSLNVREDRLVAQDLVFFSEEANKAQLSKSKLRAGDVLIVRTGYPGTSCVVPKEYDGANCIDLVIARPKLDLLSSEYLSRFFNSPAGRGQAVSAKVGFAQQHLNVGAVKRTLVPLPPIAQQGNIVASLAAVDAKLAAEERRREALDALFKSLLHHLMTGKVRLPEFARGST